MTKPGETRGGSGRETEASSVESAQIDREALVQIARMPMPFGRYQGTRLLDLPEPYVVWFAKRGFPKGRLGMLLATLYEIKVNGLEPMLSGFREPSDPRYRPRDPRTFREGDR
jgi:uncharacterized protein (DUF3820 family)